MTDFKEIHKNLIEPIEYKFRVQSINDKTATIVSYIDSRDLQNRLDDVVGSENWQVKYEDKKGTLFASIGIFINDNWVWKSDCGTESNVEKEKGEASDAFKRAGVMWGIGRFLYSLPIISLKSAKYNGKNYPADEQGNIIWGSENLNKYCASINSMPEDRFNKLLSRINNGEKGIVKSILDHNLKISQTQLTILKSAEEKQNGK